MSCNLNNPDFITEYYAIHYLNLNGFLSLVGHQRLEEIKKELSVEHQWNIVSNESGIISISLVIKNAPGSEECYVVKYNLIKSKLDFYMKTYYSPIKINQIPTFIS